MQKTIHRFSHEDDEIIKRYFKKYANDRNLAIQKIQEQIGKHHKKKSIEERYRSFLSRNMNPFTQDEDRMIMQLHMLFKNSWASIAKQLQTNRSGDQVKIRFGQLTRQKKPTPSVVNQTQIPIIFPNIEGSLPSIQPNDSDISYLEFDNLLNPRH